ncbi:PKD domain-containing protein [Haloarchaeobius amylolyticus]|uniref:PKD domain-containing protein n=1 Tax=Haloarchaeobius amylolyticus TaxID=1198296 RepID=UPI00226DBAA8|nr:PKD domain-containing protein [Haloarchaeobius amylolyticus]
MTTEDTGSRLALGLLLLALVLAPVVGAATVSAGSTAPPSPPAAYYGQVLVDGEPAPAGVELVAVVDGEVRGTITTDENGTYGGSESFDEKLEVSGNSSEDAGATVSFRVAGASADTTVAWESGDHREVDVSLSDSGAPTAALGSDREAAAGETLAFDGSNSTDDTAIARYEWSVDGQTKTGESAAFTFEEAGEYEVSLTVTDLAGRTDTATATVTVGDGGGAGGGGAGGGGQGGDEQEGTVKIANWSVTPTSPEPGEEITMTVTVVNTADDTREITPALYVDGELIEGKRISVLSGTERSVQFTYVFEEAGTHTLSPDTLDVRTIQVGGETTTTDPGTTATTTDPGTTDRPTTTAGSDTSTSTTRPPIQETGGGLELWQIGMIAVLAAAAAVAALLVRWA